MNPLLRAYRDLMAYGRHLECCKSGGGPMVAGPNAVRIKPLYVDRDGVKHWAPCSCGLKEALDALEKELGFGKWRRKAA